MECGAPDVMILSNGEQCGVWYHHIRIVSGRIALLHYHVMEMCSYT